MIISNDSGGKLAKRLKALKIPVMLEPAAAKLGDVYAQISLLGLAGCGSGDYKSERRQRRHQNPAQLRLIVHHRR